MYKKQSSGILPIPFLATTYIPQTHGLPNYMNLIGTMQAGRFGAFYLKRSEKAPYKFRLQSSIDLHHYIECRMIAKPFMQTQDTMQSPASFTFDLFSSNKPDTDNILMCIFFRALCFHMASISGSDGPAEMCRFIMYTDDVSTPRQRLVTSGLLFSSTTNTWRDYIMEIPNFHLHKWAHSFPLPNNINERILYGCQPPLSLGAVEKPKKRKALLP